MKAKHYRLIYILYSQIINNNKKSFKNIKVQRASGQKILCDSKVFYPYLKNFPAIDWKIIGNFETICLIHRFFFKFARCISIYFYAIYVLCIYVLFIYAFILYVFRHLCFMYLYYIGLPLTLSSDTIVYRLFVINSL